MPSELSAYALTTLQKQKDFMGADDNHDTLIERLINAVSVACENYCGTYLKKRTGIVEYHDGEGGYVLILRNVPTTDGALTSIYDDPDREYTASYLIDSDDYVIDLETGIFQRDDEEFSTGLQNIKVTYNAGYATIPADLELAVWKWVAHIYNEQKDKRWGLQSLQSGGEQTSYIIRRMEGEPPTDIAAVLNKYRVVRL